MPDALRRERPSQLAGRAASWRRLPMSMQAREGAGCPGTGDGAAVPSLSSTAAWEGGGWRQEVPGPVQRTDGCNGAEHVAQCVLSANMNGEVQSRYWQDWVCVLWRACASVEADLAAAAANYIQEQKTTARWTAALWHIATLLATNISQNSSAFSGGWRCAARLSSCTTHHRNNLQGLAVVGEGSLESSLDQPQGLKCTPVMSSGCWPSNPPSVPWLPLGGRQRGKNATQHPGGSAPSRPGRSWNHVTCTGVLPTEAWACFGSLCWMKLDEVSIVMVSREVCGCPKTGSMRSSQVTEDGP